jgi:hypothetical protein
MMELLEEHVRGQTSAPLPPLTLWDASRSSRPLGGNESFENKETIAMEDLSPLAIVTDFIECINQGDLQKVNSYISTEVIFTDIQGRVYLEPEFMEEYLKTYPNYKIHVKNILRGGDGVAIVGYTTGSHVNAEIEEDEVLVWTVEMRDSLITEWRIYSTERYANFS